MNVTSTPPKHRRQRRVAELAGQAEPEQVPPTASTTAPAIGQRGQRLVRRGRVPHRRDRRDPGRPQRRQQRGDHVTPMPTAKTR